MRLRRRLFAQSLIVAVVVAVAVGWWTARDNEDPYVLDSTAGSIALNKVSEGRMLAIVDVQDMDGNLVSTDTLIGEPLVVNFWFSTCEPCRREFPVLVRADERYPQLRFVGINLSDTAERASAFAAQFGATFDMLFDRDGRLTTAMGVATAPVTLIIDAGGVVRRQITGEVTDKMLDEALSQVFPS